jgi:hypothetical protein
MTEMQKSAVISRCGKYRYVLRRTWDTSTGAVLFICLNPSTADHRQDDNTSRICINYAKRWGYGGVIIANLFAYRATDPTRLKEVEDPVGPENDRHLRKLIKAAPLTVCAWSKDGDFMNRDSTVLDLLHHPYCLTILKSGHPGHPLYKKSSLTPIPFEI